MIQSIVTFQLQSEPGGKRDPNPPGQLYFCQFCPVEGSSVLLFRVPTCCIHLLLLHLSFPSLGEKASHCPIFFLVNAVLCKKCQDGVLGTKCENAKLSIEICSQKKSQICIPKSKHCGTSLLLVIGTGVTKKNICNKLFSLSSELILDH